MTPEDFLGDIIGDLNSRRGRIEGMEPQQGGADLKGRLGRGSSLLASCCFPLPSSHEAVPRNVADEIIQKSGGAVAAK